MLLMSVSPPLLLSVSPLSVLLCLLAVLLVLPVRKNLRGVSTGSLSTIA
jgi:hypothetical protein